MRRLAEAIFSALIKLHTFTLRRQVKVSASLLYVFLAVIGTIWRAQFRVIGRTILSLPWSLHLRALVSAVFANVGQIVQQAQNLF